MKALLVSLLIAACSTLAIAQDAHIPPVLQITRESIKEGRAAAHEKVETDYARAFRKSKIAPYYVALTSMSGPSEAWFITPYTSFAGVEKSAKDYEKSSMKNDLDTMDSRDGELRANSRSMYAVFRKDLSLHAELMNLARVRFMGVGTFRVKLGHEDELIEGGKAIMSAREKAGINHPTLCYQVIAGVPDGMFLFFEPMETLADWDEVPAMQKKMAEAMGPENLQKLMKGAGNVFNSMQNDLFQVNPRMSFMSKETEDADPAFWRPKAPAAKPSGQ